MSDSTISIFMMGARRTGKTTILASMNSQLNDITRGTNLTITSSGGASVKALTDCVEALRDNLEQQENDFFHIDEKQTSERDIYSFLIKSTGANAKNSMKISFNDVPGEWFRNEKGISHEEEIRDLIETSQVIMIAIDTPALMEEPSKALNGVGTYNEKNNATAVITNYIRSYLTSEENSMVLFVPLKCEKQYHKTLNKIDNAGNTNYMKKINENIKEAYKDLIGYLTSPNMRNKCTVAITPIITVGGIEFFQFGEEDPESGLLTQKYYVLPGAKHEPKFCEQPMLYTLAFAIEEYNRRLKEQKQNESAGKKPEGFFPRLFHSIFEFFNKNRQTVEDIQDFLEMDGKGLHRKKEDGYEILQNPLNL